MALTLQEYREVVMDLLPEQGSWRDVDYLWLTDRAERLIELTDGRIEVLPMPTDKHQGLLLFFMRLFLSYVEPRGGVVRFAPLRLRLREGKYREPDLLLLLERDDPRREDRYWHGADLVLEVVSPDDPARDLVEKRRDYAEVGIPEYWIVNALDGSIIVLTLQGRHYAEHGVFRAGTQATSPLLPGFAVDVEAAFRSA